MRTVVLLVVVIILLSGCLHGGVSEGNLSGATADAENSTEDSSDRNSTDTSSAETESPPEPYTEAEVAFVSDGEEVGSLNVEVADTPREHFRGLRFRESLPNGTGMLFVYQRPERKDFTMQDTRIPLDIIFVDSDMRVLNVKHATPEPDVPSYRAKDYLSDGPAMYAVEAQQGYANRTGISPGDRLVIREAE